MEVMGNEKWDYREEGWPRRCWCKSAENIDFQLLDDFNTQEIYTKSNSDFIKKLETHFKNKKSVQECTSFLNTVHNLYTQHIGKMMK